ncbi:hypothetical protein GCM10009415_17930 [Chitinophaga japonensis]
MLHESKLFSYTNWAMRDDCGTDYSGCQLMVNLGGYKKGMKFPSIYYSAKEGFLELRDEWGNEIQTINTTGTARCLSS